MIIYNVTVKIESEVAKEWLQWMKNEHIPEVIHTGLFTHARILKLIGHDDEQGIAYAIQYHCRDMASLEKYQAEFAKELQSKHTERYKDKYVAFRTIMQELWTREGDSNNC